MNDDLAEKIITTPKKAKSLMWYVGWIIVTGFVGISVMLFLMEVIFI